MYKRLLVATDGSELSKGAAQSALELAKRLGAEVIAVRVVGLPAHVDIGGFRLTELPENVRQRILLSAEKDLDWVRQEAHRVEVECRTVLAESDHPWRGIVDTAAKEQCDLIIMARYGRRSLAAKLIASETQKVLTHSMTDVLIHHSARTRHGQMQP